MKATKVEALSLSQMSNFIARRPVYTVLGTEKYERLTGRSPRDWRAAVEDYVRKWFMAQPSSFYANGITKLPIHWEKCVEKSGDYVEK